MINLNSLGKSNIKVSSIGFGGAPIGDLFENLENELCIKILNKSHKYGINFYDTSPFYGCGLSEIRLGQYLSTIDRNDFILSTKSGYNIKWRKETL